jgi:hypothetical protein
VRVGVRVGVMMVRFFVVVVVVVVVMVVVVVGWQSGWRWFLVLRMLRVRRRNKLRVVDDRRRKDGMAWVQCYKTFCGRKLRIFVTS